MDATLTATIVSRTRVEALSGSSQVHNRHGGPFIEMELERLATDMDQEVESTGLEKG